MREISAGKSVFLSVPGRGGKRRRTKFLETLIGGKGTNLNLHNNLTLVYCALSDHLL